MLTILLVFLPSMWSAPSTPSVPFTDLLSKVDTGQVESVGINEQGAIKGALRDGTSFTSQIPTALGDNRLQQALHRDAQTAQTAGRAGRIAEDRPDAGVQRGLRRAGDRGRGVRGDHLLASGPALPDLRLQAGCRFAGARAIASCPTSNTLPSPRTVSLPGAKSALSVV
jgi:hypothetical protein